MAYVAYVTNLKNLRKHPNADRLQLAECFGNTVCVNMDYTADQLGVYFPTDGQLSMEFCEQNGLLAVYVDGVNVSGGYMDPEKRNVKTIKLRGEKSDGLFLPLTCLAYTGVDITTFKAGDTIALVNGHEICTKYIPKRNPRRSGGNGAEGNRTRKKKVAVAPLFMEHADTEQLAYNLDAFKPGDLIEITLKMHGTSQRTANLPRFDGYKRTLMDRIMRREGVAQYNWGSVSGTRRVVLDNYDGGYYGSNEFREAHSKFFDGKLHKGETVYYEVVGFTTSGSSIMGDADNKKLKDKEFVKLYGPTTVFSYGCEPTGKKTMYGQDDKGAFEIEIAVPQSDIYVYRMTMTNEDGDVVEYTPDFMRYRCEQMGAKTVPVFAKGHICMDGSVSWVNMLTGEDMTTAIGDEVRENDPYSFEFNPGDSVKAVAEQFYDGPDPIGKTHVREGVVVRIVNRPKFAAYKHKNFSFKVLEGIIKEVADAPDMEEAQDVVDNGEE